MRQLEEKEKHKNYENYVFQVEQENIMKKKQDALSADELLQVQKKQYQSMYRDLLSSQI